MPSTDRKLELQAKNISVSTLSQTTAYWTDVASPVASEMTERSNGLQELYCITEAPLDVLDVELWFIIGDLNFPIEQRFCLC